MALLDWAARSFRSLAETIFDPFAVTNFRFLNADRRGVDAALDWVLFDTALPWIVDKVDVAIGRFQQPVIALSSHVLKRITGVDVDVAGFATAPAGRDQAMGIGGEFMKVVESVFNKEVAQNDMATRSGIAGGTGNLAAFFGTNLIFQLRSLAIGTVASIVPVPGLKHLEGLHQAVNWAFGFGWLSWAVMSEYMNVTTIPSVRRYLNSFVKPNDFSEAETYHAFLAGKITSSLFSQIMDNLGVRNDIRDIILDLREAALSDSDLQDLFEHDVIPESDIAPAFRLKGYRQSRALLKAQTIIQAREWKLKAQETQSRIRLFRDCVIPEAQLRAWLAGQGYSALEEDLVVHLAIDERKQRRFLSLAQMKEAIKEKHLTSDEARADLLCQGYTDRDAAIILEEVMAGPQKPPLIQAFSVSPTFVTEKGVVVISWAVKNADSVSLSRSAGTAAGSAVGVDAVGSISEEVSTQTLYTLSAKNALGTVTRTKLVVVRFDRPALSFSVSPNSITIGLLPTDVELRWHAEKATSVTISPFLGAVGLEGSRIVGINSQVTFTATATGPGGRTSRSESVIARLPTAPGLPGAAGPPTGTFSVSPTFIFPGAEVIVSWNIRGADKVEIDQGVGTVEAVGTRILRPMVNTTYTLTATNKQGTLRRQDTVVTTT